MASSSSSSLRGASSRSGLARSSSTTSNSANPTLRRQGSTDLNYANLENDEDFERLLASYDVPLVVDTLRRYLAMEVQSSLAGTASTKQNSAQIKRKFYERFNQILDRLCGNDEVSKRKYGGWLDYSVGLASAASAGATASGGALAAAQRKKRFSATATANLSAAQLEELRMESYIDSLTPSGRALTEFLGFVRQDEAGSMFQLLFKMTHPVEFKLELDLLPEQSKLSLLSHSAFTSVLFTQLLQKPITKQRVDPRNPVLLVSIKELYLFYFMRHPACANHPSSPATSEAAAAAVAAGSNSSNSSGSSGPRSSSTNSSSAGSATSSLMGSLSDTFASRPKRRENYSWRAFFNDGVTSLTRGNPYNVLLLQYLKLFFPDSSKPVESRFHGKLLQHSNLFLHVLIEFWLRQNLIVFSDDASSSSAAAVSMDWSGYRMQQRLASPFATVLTQTSYMAPSDDLLSSLLLTVIHLLADPFFPAPLDASSSSSSTASTSSPSAAAAAAMYSGMVVGSGGGFLSPSVTVLRRPLYEFFRLVFSRAPIGLSPTAFLAITDVWLAYIQPWNCKHWAKGQAPTGHTGNSNGSDDTAPLGFSAAWQTFVLANYHFYTTLLGGFIERAKELDFTGSDERALVILDRVLTVFNPELLALLRGASDFLDKNQPYSIGSSSSSVMQISSRTATTKSNKTQTSSDRQQNLLSPQQGQVLTYYCKTLGIECVGVPLHGCYHRDAERVFDKLWGDSGFSASGADSAAPQRSPRASAASTSSQKPRETALERVHRLSRLLRRVFEISDAYVASTVHSRAVPSANGLEPLEPSRHSKLRHLLTRTGIQQLRRGLRLCSPDELQYIGDPMVRPICSFEVAWLVRLSFRVSSWLNRKCGLASAYTGKHFEYNARVDPSTKFTSFRFNLRFLASKPNLVFLSVLLLLVYLVVLW